MQLEELKKVCVDALEDLKALELKVLDVRDLTSVTDMMIIVSGTSNRHLKALADSVLEKTSKHGLKPLGVEGLREAEWALLDFGDIVIHIMLPQVRATYNLEKLWDKDLLTLVESRRVEGAAKRSSD